MNIEGLFANSVISYKHSAASCSLKLMAIVVNRSDASETEKLLRDRRVHLQLSAMARGTCGSSIMDILGLGQVDKSVILCVAQGRRIDSLLVEIKQAIKLRKAGKGIAFTVPMFGLCLPESQGTANCPDADYWSDTLEKEVDSVNSEIKHSLVLALVNQGYSEDVVKTAIGAGAKGGTVINARGTGAEGVVKFFGLTVQPEKEVISILSSREKNRAIMNAINESYGAGSPAHGIVISLPVDGVAGVEI